MALCLRARAGEEGQRGARGGARQLGRATNLKESSPERALGEGETSSQSHSMSLSSGALHLSLHEY